MELLGDFLKILLPAALVLIGMYLTAKAMTERLAGKITANRIVSNPKEGNIALFQSQLQAIERMVLYLERINPENMLLRINRSGMIARELQQQMLSDIREEYSHNLAQQIYVSDQAWTLLKQSKEDINAMVNKASERVAPDAKSMELARAIMEEMLLRKEPPVANAIAQLKAEARVLLRQGLTA
jgi:hypothetical protein